MNHRSLRDSLIGSGGNISDDNSIDLFSKCRRSLSLASSSDVVSVKLEIPVGSAKPTKNGLDDLLSSTDGGKHDYDWLLTPPGTPLFPTSNGNESQTVPVALRSSSLARSISATKAVSRLSVSQSSESNNRPKPVRSSSVTRASISASQCSSYSNKSSFILNTSSASVSSHIRPSTPSSRSSSAARTSNPSSRPTLSRSSTPSKASPAASAASADKVRQSQNSRPSTPTTRPQIPANLNSPAVRSTSRPSTPTRRNPASGPSFSVSRSLQNGQTMASTSRPSSPNPRVRPTQQPILIPDFSLETPPNLRTTLPDRPLSAGRSGPGVAVTLKRNVEKPDAASLPRRQSSPIVTRGRLPEPSARGRMPANGQLGHNTESYRVQHVSDLSTKNPVRASTESTGFGRTISKKSLDMAIRHMDIKNVINGVHPLSGSTVFPQSIRSANTKGQLSSTAIAQASGNGDVPIYHNGATLKHRNFVRSLENGNEEDKSHFSARLSVVDICESSRYDTLLLREDLKNTNWLHSIDDKSDQGAIFDNGFDPLPEPFDPL